MKCKMDILALREGVFTAEGWCIPAEGHTAEYRVTDSKGKERNFEMVPRDRMDVAKQYNVSSMCGFSINIPDFERNDTAFLYISDGKSTRKFKLNDEAITNKNSVKSKNLERLLALCQMETVEVSIDFIKENGFSAFVKKAVHKLAKISEDYDYPEWYEKTVRSASEIEAEKERWKEFGFINKDFCSVCLDRMGNAENHTKRDVNNNTNADTNADTSTSIKSITDKDTANADTNTDTNTNTNTNNNADSNTVSSYPLFSIVIPTYNTDEKYLKMLFDSLLAQTYPNFEVIVSDGSEGSTSVKRTTEKYAVHSERFRYVSCNGNLGISGNTNRGLKEANGDYIVLCDHDDELPPWALFEVAKAISENPDAELIYTDEDKIDFDGKALFEPHFKSDFSMDLLCSVNYICHLAAIRKDLVEATGGFREDFDGAQDHDFFLRACEIALSHDSVLYDKAAEKLADGRSESSPKHTCATDYDKAAEKPADGRNESSPKHTCVGGYDKTNEKLAEGRFVSNTIIHVPVVCYHWRYHKGSTASDPKAKLYAFEAGSRAVKAHYDRIGQKYKDVEVGVDYGIYHTVFDTPKEQPLISVIIPNKDHRDDLKTSIFSIIEKSEYRNLEFIVIENNSTDPETFKYYETIQKDPRIKVVTWKDEFNYSAINNFGVGFAKGDYLLFLNNDTELMSPSSITEMYEYVKRDDTGICGARLIYQDDTIQHAGVIVGIGGIAGAAFTGLHIKENSYMHRMMCTQNLSAVTAACFMMKKADFEKAGGFREKLKVAFNDIDLCLKIRALGKLVVYAPYASFYHYESKSRGLEDTPEKVKRFNGEIAEFASHWGKILENGDPYYNPNLTLRKQNFALRDISREKPGEPYPLELDVDEYLRAIEQEEKRRAARNRQ